MAAFDDRLHPLLAGEDRAAVHPHPARPADHHPAALAVRERPVVAVLDDVEHVEQAGPLGRLDLVGLQLALAVLVDAPDLERDVHRRALPGMDSGFAHLGSVTVLGIVSVGVISSKPPDPTRSEPNRRHHGFSSAAPSEASHSRSINLLNSSWETTSSGGGASMFTGTPKSYRS